MVHYPVSYFLKRGKGPNKQPLYPVNEAPSQRICVLAFEARSSVDLDARCGGATFSRFHIDFRNRKQLETNDKRRHRLVHAALVEPQNIYQRTVNTPQGQTCWTAISKLQNDNRVELRKLQENKHQIKDAGERERVWSARIGS